MAKKTINQALKDLFLGLGGDPSALADNTSASDYIADLESAIKAAATAELPTPEAEDIGKIVSVVSDGDEGAEYDLTTPATPEPEVVFFDAGGVKRSGQFPTVTITSHTKQQVVDILGNDLAETGKPKNDVYLRFYVNSATGSTGSELNQSVRLRFTGIVDNGELFGTNAHFEGIYTYSTGDVYYAKVDLPLKSTTLSGSYDERKITFTT